MLKSVVFIVGVVITTLLLAYLLGSFAAASFNITEWGSEQRDCIATVLALLFIFFGIPFTLSKL